MKYFTIKELTHSDTANKYHIDNTPDAIIENHLKQLIEELLDPIREKWGYPIRVNSGYRCKALNDKLPNASKTSQHMKGFAADITAGSQKSNKELYALIRSMVQHKEITLDQCINECRGGKAWQWIHVSLAEKNKKNRNYFFSLANY